MSAATIADYAIFLKRQVVECCRGGCGAVHPVMQLDPPRLLASESVVNTRVAKCIACAGASGAKAIVREI